MSTEIVAEPGSFRDPAGRVYYVGDRVFRLVNPVAAPDFEFVESGGLLAELVKRGLALPVKRADKALLGAVAADAAFVLEAPRIPFVSYPYEWPFSALKAAAILHLDIQLVALDHDVTLSDASAYNVQFQGGMPIFIDHLSFRRYRPGEIWTGHRQFCEQFLNPLVMRAMLGLSFNAWYRGAQEGIPATALLPMLKKRHLFNRSVFTHVALQAWLQNASQHRRGATAKPSGGVNALPRESLRKMLTSLRRSIARLGVSKSENTVWQHYADDNSYSSTESTEKRRFISEFASKVKPHLLLDFGCNTGEYAEAALAAGAAYVVGFDFDTGALEGAYARARDRQLAFLPLFLDATNPSPDQGWRQRERKGIAGRATANALVALAFVHHLAIARNIPLDQLVEWLTGFAPSGVIEFVPKGDSMVQRLLENRDDIFTEYDERTFVSLLSRSARIVASKTVSASGRQLFWYSRA